MPATDLRLIRQRTLTLGRLTSQAESPRPTTLVRVLQDLVDQFHELLQAGADGPSVFAILDAIRDTFQPGEAAILVHALERADANFFSREVVGVILCELGQPDLLEPLLVAFDVNLAEGHDNDSFAAALCSLVEANQRASAETLHRVRASRPATISTEAVEWLLDWCDKGRATEDATTTGQRWLSVEPPHHRPS